MKVYADYTYYQSGTFEGDIPEEEFAKYSKRASQEMNVLTHNSITNPDIEEIKDCCCEIADLLYKYDKAHGESGALVSSYSNDGQSASLDLSTSEFTKQNLNKNIRSVAHIYLLPLGLMYAGVR